MASIVFDLDGTLIDSAPDLQKIANELLQADDHAPISLIETCSFIGNGASVFVEKMCAARGVPKSSEVHYIEAFLKAYQSAFGLTELYPGVLAALEKLKAQGHKLGICTNKPIGPCRAVLEHLKLTNYFDTIIGGDSLPVKKPDPATLFAAFDALDGGVSIYVGDSEVDAETALRAKAPFLLFTEGYRKTAVDQIPHTAAFSNFDQLEDLVARY
ncbi:MAG: phosphoglycolate phosphatase [Hyphomicrobiales bacterium]